MEKQLMEEGNTYKKTETKTETKTKTNVKRKRSK